MLWIKNEKKIRKTIYNLWSVVCSVCGIYCAIKYSAECSSGILNGLSFCFTVLVPSLFVFMVIAQYSASNGFNEISGKLLGRFISRVCKLEKESSGVIIMSMIGGYPIGARCIASLYDNKKISADQAKKLALIAVSSGPGFVINYVGSALLNNKLSACVLMVSQVIAFFTVTIIAGRTIKVKNEDIVCIKIEKQGFVEAVESGCKGTISMCALVIVFSAIFSIAESILSKQTVLCDAIACVLEVTNGCNRICGRYPLYIVSFVLGFGGICVHCQIYSALKKIKINKFLFFLFRIIQGITSSVTTYILLILFPVTTEVFSTAEKATPSLSTPIWGSAALILTAVCFLNSLSNTKLRRR